MRAASRKDTGAIPREKCEEEVGGRQDPDASWAKAEAELQVGRRSSGWGWMERQGSHPTLAKAGDSLAAKQKQSCPRGSVERRREKTSFKSQQFIIPSQQLTVQSKKTQK